MLLAAGPAAAQGLDVVGAVAHGGRTGRPRLPGRWAVLHRVTPQGGAALDSTRTDAAGRYRFRLATLDSSAVYLVSTEWHGIGYFSLPVRGAGRPADTLETLVVYDTSVSGPPIQLVSRLVTLARLEKDGSLAVLEAWHVENPGQTARVARDTAHPVWSVALPAGATEFQARESDVSPEAIVRRGDTAAVFGTVAPGGTREIAVTYTLPAETQEVAVPVDQPTGQVDILVEGEGASVTGPALQRLEAEMIEGRRFQRFRAEGLDRGAVLVVAVPRPGSGDQAVLPYVVGALALVLGGGLYVAFRPRRSVAARG